MNSLKTQFKKLKSENSSLYVQTASLSDRIISLKTNEIPSSPPALITVSQPLHELSERKTCCSNLIAHGVQESSSSEVKSKVKDDLKHLANA